MKIHIEIECTPQEARSFLGLPDLNPVHAAYIDALEKLVRGKTASAADVEKMMRSWGSGLEGGLEGWMKLMQQMGGSGSSGKD